MPTAATRRSWRSASVHLLFDDGGQAVEVRFGADVLFDGRHRSVDEFSLGGDQTGFEPRPADVDRQDRRGQLPWWFELFGGIVDVGVGVACAAVRPDVARHGSSRRYTRRASSTRLIW